MALDTESFYILLPTIQRLVLERLVPAENHLEEHDDVPGDVVEDMKEMGLFGLTVPEEYGGIGSPGILMDGTLEQKAEYLPKVASGALTMSFALTEPDAGTDAASLKTRAEVDDDQHVLNGTKRYITNAPRAGALHVDGAHRRPGRGRGCH